MTSVGGVLREATRWLATTRVPEDVLGQGDLVAETKMTSSAEKAKG